MLNEIKNSLDLQYRDWYGNEKPMLMLRNRHFNYFSYFFKFSIDNLILHVNVAQMKKGNF